MDAAGQAAPRYVAKLPMYIGRAGKFTPYSREFDGRPESILHHGKATSKYIRYVNWANPNKRQSKNTTGGPRRTQDRNGYFRFQAPSRQRINTQQANPPPPNHHLVFTTVCYLVGCFPPQHQSHKVHSFREHFLDWLAKILAATVAIQR